MIVTHIQQRFGYQALRRASEPMQVHETLSTGMEAVDGLLDGGLLKGATHSLSGQATSGRNHIAISHDCQCASTGHTSNLSGNGRPF